MAKNYVNKSGLSAGVTSTPQNVKANENQVKNNAGGYSFKTNDMQQVRRFLVLGSDKNTYYTSSKKLSADNAKNIINLLNSSTEKGIAVVDEIVNVSDNNLAPKNDPAIFALALAASCDDANVRKYALDNLQKVCRIGTHLFTFITYVDELRGWGRGLRNSISSWYTNKKISSLAYQVCKYPQRRVEGESPWSHRDVLRKVHLKADGKMNTIMRYVVKGIEDFSVEELESLKNDSDLKYIWAHEQSKKATTAKEVVSLIKNYGITRESVPTEMFKNKTVWKALLNDMPMTAMLRNIRNMTKVGLLTPMSDEAVYVADRLRDQEELLKNRIHPIAVLNALVAYDHNKFNNYNSYWYGGYNDDNTAYTPVETISDALEEAFYASFGNVKPTGKKVMLALDVSGSMSQESVGSNLSCAMASTAMAMLFARTEKKYMVRGFCDRFVDLGITAKDSLESAMTKTRKNNFGGTDCSLPMQWAYDNKTEVDTFMVFTDNETWAGRSHPHEVLAVYRKKFVKDAKLIVVGMAANDFTIADPNDVGSLDVVGFDTSVPDTIYNFVKGDL